MLTLKQSIAWLTLVPLRRRSGCAKPVALIKGKPRVRLACQITFQGKRRHLPVIALKYAA